MSQYSTKDIVVVIPVYKEVLNSFEEVSFRQVCNILNKYDITIACPELLNIDNYKRIAGEASKVIRKESFNKTFFEGIAGYNELMLSSVFYERFSTYKFMLIYQLDCYVFKDELLYWTNLNYDYIGAPWIFNDYRKWTLSQKIRYQIKRTILRYTNAPNNITTTYYKVGNGGFSLRKIDSFLSTLNRYQKSNRLAKYKQEDTAVLNEDVFWSREVNRYFPFFKIPNYKIGLNFAFDVNPRICYEINKQNLPFGCHAWQRYDLEFWAEFINIAEK